MTTITLEYLRKEREIIKTYQDSFTSSYIARYFEAVVTGKTSDILPDRAPTKNDMLIRLLLLAGVSDEQLVGMTIEQCYTYYYLFES